MSITETVGGVQDPPALSARARTVALLCLLTASFMELMDATVVNVALRTMQSDLGLSAAALQWIAAGYPLAYASGLVLGARLGDRYGRRRLFVVGLAAFGAASFACGLAADPASLVAFRFLQGLAAALMVPQVLTCIQVLYPPAQRGTAMGMFTSVIGLAAVAGPLLGGVITAGDWWGMSWRPIFLINVPIAVLAILAARAFLPESKAQVPAPIVVRSAVLLGAGLASLMVPITVGPEHGWPAWGFGCMALGVGLLAEFGRRQWTSARRGVEPMVPPAVFATRSFTAGLAAFAAFMVPTGGFFLVQSLYVQSALGFSVLRTGLMWLPFSVTVFVAAGLSATVLAPRFGASVLRCGALVFAVGVVTMMLAARTDDPYWWLALTLVLAGVGFGLVVGSAGLLVLDEVPVHRAGAASGVFNTVQALSVAVGAAAIGTIFTSATSVGAGYRASMTAMVALLVFGAVVSLAMPGRRAAAVTGQSR
ncbi:MAG: MFS transporter [Gordonia polyisoprenivorans]|nr:MFS transporter [Gordonia polyisoprenivorans]